MQWIVWIHHLLKFASCHLKEVGLTQPGDHDTSKSHNHLIGITYCVEGPI